MAATGDGPPAILLYTASYFRQSVECFGLTMCQTFPRNFQPLSFLKVK